MATRHLIERLSERIDALAARLMPSRTFVAYVRNGLNEQAEIAAFREKHGVTDHDLLIVVAFVRSPNEDYDGTGPVWTWTSRKRVHVLDSEPSQQQPQVGPAPGPLIRAMSK
jgi:hypothetical protein